MSRHSIFKMRFGGLPNSTCLMGILDAGQQFTVVMEWFLRYLGLILNLRRNSLLLYDWISRVVNFWNVEWVRRGTSLTGVGPTKDITFSAYLLLQIDL